jgi:homoserine dehydrogenase
MRDINIAMFGLGNIGSGVMKILSENKDMISNRYNIDFIISGILVRDINKRRDIDIDKSLLTDRVEKLISDKRVSVVIEVLGGVNPAREYILMALKAGKTVVTANKEVLARHWQEFHEAAKDSGAGLYYEASVAGGIPIIKVLNQSMQANSITEIMGIINGTTNYILTNMSEAEKDFEEALEEAQKLGYAEPDPTADISGLDAMYKLSIMSTLAFHAKVPIDNIYREGLTHLTKEDIRYGKELGYTIKLLAIAKKKGNVIEARVHPSFIQKNHPLAAVREAYNAVFINGDRVGNLMLYGRGAGDMPTGSSIISDLITACQNECKQEYTTFANRDKSLSMVEFNDNWYSGFFIRMTVKDNPGVLSSIAGIFGKFGVSIESVIQKGHGADTATLIFVTHKALENSIKGAISEINMMDDITKVENIIRVEV